VTIESPLDVHVELDPATKRDVAAIKRWHDTAADGAIRHYLTLYRPDYTVTRTDNPPTQVPYATTEDVRSAIGYFRLAWRCRAPRYPS
jgi:hypothetical protein